MVDGITYCSSILPWRSSPGEPVWPGAGPPRNVHSGRTRYAVEALLGELPRQRLVWGGDWNHSLSGDEWAGTKGGRAHVLAAVDEMGLQFPTAELPHRLDGLFSIDHVAVPTSWTVHAAERLDATGLSEHDCYVVDVDVPTAQGTA